ncbi:MAG: arginine repressor [Propionibacteriaceae bacterium]|nr:arginine repressor [Propionibacteriaceae bacterium]
MAEAKAVRLARVRAILERRTVTSQAELGELLASEGISVSQGTLSKDLLELGAVRERNDDGALVYVVPPRPVARTNTVVRLRRLCREVLLSAEASANLVLLKTPPGAAQYFASAIDDAKLDEVLGTVAGDDTVLLVARQGTSGESLAHRFRQMVTSG